MNLHDLITQGHLEQALAELLKITENTDFYEDCAMQSASFHRIEQDLEKGLITPQDANLPKNRITHALLSILKRYEKEYGKVEGEIEPEISQKEKPKTENTMTKNSAEINGNHNTVIQDVENSNIQTGGTHIQKSGVPAWLVAFLVGIIVVAIVVINLDKRKDESNNQTKIQNTSPILYITVATPNKDNFFTTVDKTAKAQTSSKTTNLQAQPCEDCKCFDLEKFRAELRKDNLSSSNFS